ncbi:MAG: hypothetical protein H6710_04635 [Myxococcales bacterium]|nr:hypothetical protein [Myxococcales bacterium]
MAASTGPERWLPGRGARRGGSRLALALGLAALGASGLGVAAPSAAAAASVGPRSYDGPEAAPADEAPRGVGADEVPEASASGALVEGPALPAASTTSGPEVDAVALRLTIYRAGERLPDGARTPRRGGAVEGEAVYTLDRPARAGERVRLLNFAEAMTREPIELDTIALSTYLDGPFQPGRLDLLGHEGAASVARVGERRDLEVVLEEGAQELRLRYRVAVPHRYWPFGCARRRCSLSGAIAPLPTEAATGGRYLPADGVAIAPAHWRVESVRFAAAPSWEPGREPTDAEAAALKGDEIVVADAPVGGRGLASYPSVFWGPRWRRVTEIHNGVRIELLHTLWRPGDHYPSERKLQLYRDVPGHVLHAIKDVLDVAAASRVEPPPDTRMVIVQGPLRSSLAEAHPTALLISDQILQVFPMERFLEFHAEVVARGGFDVLAHAFFAGRHAASTDLWLQGSLAMALLDLWRVHRATRDEFASDILGRLTFVPAVDNFLYAGQAEFTAAYFRGSEDTFPVRNHPWLAGNELPTGRRIHEKLRDLVPPAALGAFYQALTRAPDVDPIAAAEEAYGHTLGWFFDQWLGPYPKVDYRIARIASEPERGGWRHRITVARASEAALIEPVQVLVSERSGEHHYLIWNGELGPDGGGEGLDGEPASGEHTFELWTATKLRAVAVDPRARLLETPRPPADNVDPSSTTAARRGPLPLHRLRPRPRGHRVPGGDQPGLAPGRALRLRLLRGEPPPRPPGDRPHDDLPRPRDGRGDRRRLQPLVRPQGQPQAPGEPRSALLQPRVPDRQGPRSAGRPARHRARRLHPRHPLLLSLARSRAADLRAPLGLAGDPGRRARQRPPLRDHGRRRLDRALAARPPPRAGVAPRGRDGPADRLGSRVPLPPPGRRDR